MDKRKRGEGENMLGERLQDNISARAETRGFSEQQAGSQDAGRLSNATMPPVGTYPAGLLAGRVCALSWAGYVQSM